MKGTSLKLLITIGGIEMVLNWKKVLGWFILTPMILLISYITIMVLIAKPLTLLALGFVGLFIIGMLLVTTD
jgi:hypothetical protein